MTQGLLIVFEGLDRSGKSTQISKLSEYLESVNCKTSVFKFPDRVTVIGDVINKYLKGQDNSSDHAIHLLFTANMWEKIDDMKARINDSHVVICDRYSYSGVAYSASKENMDYEWCKTMQSGLLRPDIGFFIDVPCEEIIKRKDFGEERYEKREFQEKVKVNYKRLMNESDFQWNVINGDRTVEEIHVDIKYVVEQYFNR